jgi:putative oxidoreductase
VAYVSLPMAAVLLVAMFKVHLPYGFGSIKRVALTAAGPQFGLYVACLATLVFDGSRPLGIDGFLAERRRLARRG